MLLGRLLIVFVLLPAFALAQTEETPAAPAMSVANSVLPRDLSVWGMFLQADWLVQGVMVGLAFASVLTWTVFVAKTLEIAAAARRQRTALAAIDRAPSLAKAPADALVTAAQAEFAVSAEGRPRGHQGARRLAAGAARGGGRPAHAQGTGVLATIGATAPFVGLFGTVWGIMNSFIGISKSQTTNLAVVAPGIAEALLATALGLVAAIPGGGHLQPLRAPHRRLPRAGRATPRPRCCAWCRAISGGVSHGGQARPRRATSWRRTHEINVTPFIDVMLVLLIIFMVAAPLATVDVPVDLPVSTAERQPKPDKPLYLTVNADLSFVLKDAPVAREALGSGARRRRPAASKDERIFLRADKTRAVRRADAGDEPAARRQAI